MPDSQVECRTLNRDSPGSNPLCCCYETLGIFVLSMTPQFNQLYKCVDRSGHVSGWFSRSNSSVARMLPGEAEFVSE